MTTYSSQPDDTTGIDSFLNYKAPTTNLGTDATMVVGEHQSLTGYVYRGIIKFDLSTIPSSSVITSATLSLWTYSDASANARTMYLYRVKRNWVESEVTWNVYSTGNNWTTAGCADTTDDREASAIGSIALTASESMDTEKQITLDASMVQQWVSGAVSNYGMLIQMDTELNDAYGFHSSSSATAGYRPKLVIEYKSGRRMSILI